MRNTGRNNEEQIFSVFMGDTGPTPKNCLSILSVYLYHNDSKIEMRKYRNWSIFFDLSTQLILFLYGQDMVKSKMEPYAVPTHILQ